MKSRWMIGLLSLVLAASAFFLGRQFGGSESSPGIPPSAVQAMYRLQLPDSRGQVQALSQWQGRWLVVNFWATWCPPCREEMPAFSRLQQRYAARQVQFVGLGIDDADKIQAFANKNPVSYPLLAGGNELVEVSKMLGNTRLALPYTLLIDPQGRPVFSKLGAISEEALEKVLQQHL